MTDQRKMDIALLYVEDEAGAREELSQFLTRRVRTLISASNGEEGLERFRADRPDLDIVTDIRMPVMDGLQMSRVIRQMNKGIPGFEANLFFSWKRMEFERVGVRETALPEDSPGAVPRPIPNVIGITKKGR